MSRFAWLQARTQTLAIAALLGALVIAAAITGVQLSHLYSTQVLHCQSGCDLALNDFLRHDNFLQQTLDILARVAPALFGIFWGAPLLARELESGTYRLAWTQSVTRRRWLLTKLGQGAVITLAVAGALTLTITWWYRALDAAGSNQYALLDRRDLAPIGYALFGFAAGAFLGAVIRRVVPTMAATLAVFVFARVATSVWIRPHLLPSLHKTISLLGAGGFGFVSSNGGPLTLVAKGSAGTNAWTLSTDIVTQGGRKATSAQLATFVQQHCPQLPLPPAVPPPGSRALAKTGDVSAFEACRAQAARTYHLVTNYQPAGRYWTFQWLELGIFVLLALAAAGGAYWWITRRIN